jgi:cell division protein FtsN
MVQDFAKIRPEPVLEKRAMEAPPAWSLLLTGVVTGIAVGVFGCFLLYLSGRIPPLQQLPAVTVAATTPPPLVVVEPEPEPEVEETASLTLGFYEDLLEYEVQVDATPVDIEPEERSIQPAERRPVAIETVTSQAAPAAGSGSRLLQIGAFQQDSSARLQVNMLEDLGVSAVVKSQVINGRTLHLVQAGPFASEAELDDMRDFLKRNDINSFPLAQR